ncbi:MAG: Bacterial Ig-like domain (group 2), partial [Gemmatimonadetes bacterium]|nr:Bacterial Ig-like domain (group 2) [Gemmatimonadota bacterium]
LVTTLADRVYVVDLRDPARPALTDSLIVPADVINGIAISDDGALAVLARSGTAPGQNGLVLLDLANPLHPRPLSEYRVTLPGGARSVFLDGRTAYVADAAGSLRIISLADPAAPRELGGWAMNDSGTGRHLRGIQVKDGLAYLAYWRHGLIILDVGNGLHGGTPGKPQLVSHFAYNVADWYPADWSAGANAVARYRNYVFLADEARPGLVDWTSRERIPGLGRVHMIDVSDPARPAQVAEYRLPDQGAQGLWIEQDVLYVAFGEGGLRALDVSGELRGDLAAQGREIGSVWTGDARGFRPNLPMARSVTAGGGMVVATDVNSGLWLARLTTPAP